MNICETHLPFTRKRVIGIAALHHPANCPSFSHPPHAQKNQAPPLSPSPLAPARTLGVAEVREGAADSSNRGQRGDPVGGVALVNLVYHVILKPTELFAFIGHRLDKDPSETWRQYGPLFRIYSTNTITPELLAALAQVESSGNPVDRTYWRWRWSFNPFAIYQPASSAVGLYQMIDGVFAEPRDSVSGIMQSWTAAGLFQLLYPHDPEPRHRTGVDLSGPPCR